MGSYLRNIFLGLFFCSLSSFAFADGPTYNLIQSDDGDGFIVRGDTTEALLVDIEGSDTEDCDLTSLELGIASGALTFSDDSITNLDLFDSSGDSVLSGLSFDDNDVTATITIDDFEISEDTDYSLTIEFEAADDAIIDNQSSDIIISSITDSCNGTGSTPIDDESSSIQLTGTSVSFNVISDDLAVYDNDTDAILMLDFVVTVNTTDRYTLTTIVVTNDFENFDYDDEEDGVSDFTLYMETDSDIDSASFNESVDDKISALITFGSDYETATISISETVLIDDEARFYLTYELGSSTDIIENIGESDESYVSVNAQITTISGIGKNSGYTYGPIDITAESENGMDVGIGGLVITEVESIFPSMNAGSGITDVPLIKFKAKSVRVESRLTYLVISNESETFSTNSNNNDGLTKLTWLRDTGNGDYDGIVYETLIDEIDLDESDDVESGGNDSNDDTYALMRVTDNVTLEKATTPAFNDETTFFILGDFGTNMDSGDTVSLNVDSSTQAMYDEDFDGDASADEVTKINIGSNLPLGVTPNTLVTLVDPIMRIYTDFTENSDLFNDDNGDGIRSSSDVGYTLVAGMYDLLMFVVTVDVFEDISDLSLVFDSSNGIFSDTNNGISKVSVYLDKDLDTTFSTDDIFLGDATTFYDSDRKAMVSGISLPSGSGQQLLILIDIGQRVTESVDDVSIQLVGASVSGELVSGLVPNPITPSEYPVFQHPVQISSMAISTDSVITQDDTFSITLTLESTESSTVDVVISADSDDSTIPLVYPKFYESDVSGLDLTYEFVTTVSDIGEFDSDESSSSWSSDTLTLQYSISAENLLTDGNYFIDADVYYELDSVDEKRFLESYVSRLSRSVGAGTNYMSAIDLGDSGENGGISTTTTNDSYSWTLPDLISSVNVLINGSYQEFNNYQSVPQNTKMQVVFINDGRDVDVESLDVSLNGDTLEHEAEVDTDSTDNYFSYDVDSGTLLVHSVGDSSGQITITASDLFGVEYPSMPLIFYTSDQLEINKFLVYPNPYSPSASGDSLTFGFSLTEAATVTIYVFDSFGRELTKLSSTSYSLGYNSVTWTGVMSRNNEYLPSGTYFVRIDATDSDGETISETTKLAVY